MKKGNDVLKPGDTYENSDGVFDCISGEGNTCIGCFYEHKNCDGIECSINAIILVPTTTPPKLQYPIVLVPGESIEILGLRLKCVLESSCQGCIFDSKLNLSPLCKQVNCRTYGCIITDTIVEVSK